MKFDIVIVGAGPAGLFAARELEKNFKVALIDRKSAIEGYGNRVINKDVFKALAVDNDCLIKSVDEISFISPSGLTITKKEKARGFVIDKERMQIDIFSQLQATHMFLGHEVRNISLAKNKLETDKDSFEFKHLLAADGGTSFIRSQISCEHPTIAKCYYEIFKKKDETTACILSNKFARGFYGWSIDLGDAVEIGFGNFNDPSSCFRDFLKTFFPYSSDVIKRYGGSIPLSAVRKRVYKNCILIGDAAGGEPLMGSSIHKAIDEARIASKVLLNGEPLNIYETLWNERFSGVFEFEEAARRKLDGMSDKDIDDFFRRKNELKSDGLVTGLFKDLVNQ